MKDWLKVAWQWCNLSDDPCRKHWQMDRVYHLLPHGDKNIPLYLGWIPSTLLFLMKNWTWPTAGKPSDVTVMQLDREFRAIWQGGYFIKAAKPPQDIYAVLLFVITSILGSPDWIKPIDKWNWLCCVPSWLEVIFKAGLASSQLWMKERLIGPY